LVSQVSTLPGIYADFCVVYGRTLAVSGEVIEDSPPHRSGSNVYTVLASNHLLMFVVYICLSKNRLRLCQLFQKQHFAVTFPPEASIEE
jgi:hypothetical protein